MTDSASPAEERPLTRDEADLVRRILAVPRFGHRIKGNPDEGEWHCTCDAADWETAEEHIAKVVFRGAFPFVRAAVASVTDDERMDVERLADMAVMSLGEITSVTVYGDIHREFRARFAARVRRAEYERLRRVAMIAAGSAS